MSEEVVGEAQSAFNRSDDFIDVYSNNTQFELTGWDLKIIFGQIDQSRGRFEVEQHSGVTMSWSQVKLLIYYLIFNLYIHEGESGTVQMPKGTIPVDPTPLATETDMNPQLKAIRQRMAAVRHEMFPDS